MRNTQKKLLAACAGLSLAIVPPRALADNDTWTGSTGSWSSAAAWSLGQPPATGDSVFLTQSDATNRNVAMDVRKTIGSLTLDSTGTGLMTLAAAPSFAPILTVTGDETVGLNGSGFYNGTNIANVVQGNIYVAYSPGSSSTYSGNGGGGAKFSAGNFYAGGSASAPGGAAVVNITSSDAPFSDTIAGTLKIWDTPGTLVTLSQGLLTASTIDTSGNPNRFVWTAGTIAITGAGGVTLGNNNFGTSLSLVTRELDVTGTLTVPDGAVLNANSPSISSGNFIVGGLVTSGAPGAFTWTTGRLGFTGDLSVSSTTIGQSVSVSNVKLLSVAGQLSLPSGSTLALAGGTLAAGAIDTLGSPARFSWSSGLLNVTGASGLDLSAIGTRTLTSATTLTVTNALTIPSGTALTLNGAFMSAGSIETGGVPARMSFSTGTLSITGTAPFDYTTINTSPVFPGGKAMGATNTFLLPAGAGVNITGGSINGGALVMESTSTASAGSILAGAAYIGSAGSGTLIQSGTAAFNSGSFYIGYSAGAVGNYSLSAGTLFVSNGNENIGYGGSAVVNQAGGFNSTSLGTDTIALGVLAGSSAIYNLTANGGLSPRGGLVVGSSGSGVMNQTGGSVTIGGNLIIASRAGSIGNYNITNGILTASNITLGLGTGSFVITNSTVTVPGKITINAGTSLSFNSGTLSAGSLDFTAHPSGFTWGTGTLAITGSTGFFPGTSGLTTLSINSGQTLSVTIGLDLTPGTFMSINGGSVTTSFITADGATLNLLSGTLTSNFNTEYIGNTGSATVIQSGGTHNSTSPIYLGNNTGSSGTYSLSAGTLSAPAVNEYIGNFGTGSFIQSDGTHTVSNLYIGIRTHSAGTLHLSGGTVSASTVLLGSDSFNTGGAGTLLITGGLFSCFSIKTYPITGVGITLAGGTLSTTTLDVSLNPSAFTWTAGTLAMPTFALRSTGVGTTLTLGPGKGVSATTASIPLGSSLTLSGGTITAGSFGVFGTYTETSGSAAITTLNVAPTGVFSAPKITASTLNISGSATVLPGGGASTLAALTMTAAAQLDLADNPLILHYTTTSPASTIQSLLLSGYNNGAWNGAGIRSSTAARNPSTAIGYADAADLGYTTFAGQPTASKAVLLKYTYYGDSSLDGKVDLGNDFNLFLQGYLNHGSTWELGDYNYDNQVTTADFDLFIDAYKAQGSSLGQLDQFIESSPLLSTAQKSQLLSAVPEPAVPLFAISVFTISHIRRLRRPNPRR